MLNAIFNVVRDTVFELNEMERLFLDENRSLRRIVFYAESGIYLRYYEDYIEHIIANSDFDVCYVTSDRQDPIFECAHARLKPFFIKNSVAAMFSRLDAKVLVLATPDLNMGIVRRAPEPVHHIYAFRGISSIHQGYRLGAFDHYDALLCVASYQIAEIRKTEELYQVKQKELVLTGYPLLERIYREHRQFVEQRRSSSEQPICLIAPTWDPFGKASILDSCAEELIRSLARTGFTIWVRPHPEYVKRFPKRMDAIARMIKRYENVSLQLNLASMECLHKADFLVTDHSTISMDYVLGTERPVLFVDTALRCDNPERDRLGLPVVENVYRDRFGARLSLTEVERADATLLGLHDGLDEFKKTVPAMRHELVANWGQAGTIGGDYILSRCR